MFIQKSKEALRKYCQAMRSQLPSSFADYAAQQAAFNLEQHALFKNNEQFACYFAIKDEMSTRYIIKTLLSADKKCYLPIVTDDIRLKFVLYHEGDLLSPNRFGILEPTHPVEFKEPRELDVVLLPLLGFDTKGHRLGMGGGYYDRTFDFKKKETTTKPLLIGLAYSAQQLSHVPNDEWDVSLEGIISEKGFILF